MKRIAGCLSLMFILIACSDNNDNNATNGEKVEALTLPPINEWGSKVQKISSLLSHQPMLLVGYNTKT